MKTLSLLIGIILFSSVSFAEGHWGSYYNTKLGENLYGKITPAKHQASDSNDTIVAFLFTPLWCNHVVVENTECEFEYTKYIRQYGYLPEKSKFNGYRCKLAEKKEFIATKVSTAVQPIFSIYDTKEAFEKAFRNTRISIRMYDGKRYRSGYSFFKNRACISFE